MFVCLPADVPLNPARVIGALRLRPQRTAEARRLPEYGIFRLSVREIVVEREPQRDPRPRRPARRGEPFRIEIEFLRLEAEVLYGARAILHLGRIRRDVR